MNDKQYQTKTILSRKNKKRRVLESTQLPALTQHLHILPGENYPSLTIPSNEKLLLSMNSTPLPPLTRN